MPRDPGMRSKVLVYIPSCWFSCMPSWENWWFWEKVVLEETRWCNVNLITVITPIWHRVPNFTLCESDLLLFFHAADALPSRENGVFMPGSVSSPLHNEKIKTEKSALIKKLIHVVCNMYILNISISFIYFKKKYVRSFVYHMIAYILVPTCVFNTLYS